MAILIDIRTGEAADDPINKDRSIVDSTPRSPANVALQIAEVVPEKSKGSFLVFAKACEYKTPEQFHSYWGILGGMVSAMVPQIPGKLKEDWQIKAVAFLTNKSEEFIRTNFGEREEHEKSVE
jgi:hypothetical protein